jgi:hypothetical protein
MEGVVMLDQAPDFVALFARRRLLAGRAADQGKQVIGGRSDPDRQVPGGADPGPTVGQDDHALDRDRLPALAQEPFEVVGGLIELHARRPAPGVGDRPLLDQVPVVVVLYRAIGTVTRVSRSPEAALPQVGALVQKYAS